MITGHTKNIFLFFLLSFVFCLNFGIHSACAQEASIKEILINPDKFDKKDVTVEGELIGEPLRNSQGTWINISSQGFNIGVFVKEEGVLKNLKYWGSYKQKGDYIKLVGTFFKNCPIHQEQDIHLKTLNIVRRGFSVKESVSQLKVRATIILFIICSLLALIYLIKLRKK